MPRDCLARRRRSGRRSESVIDSADQPEYERNLANLRNQLGKDAFYIRLGRGASQHCPGAAKRHSPSCWKNSARRSRSPVRTEEKPGGLTLREREVARLIVLGHSNRDIAQDLTVELKTVETHVTHIFNKLGFDSRVQIAVWAVEKGLAQPA